MTEAIAKRTLLSGKLVSNFGQSTIDCVVRSLSDVGATLQVESTHGVPDQFELVIQGRERKPCKLSWQSENRIGVNFLDAVSVEPRPETGHDLVRGQMLALRAALDEVAVGVVLLDVDMRAQFINKAFRRMWRLPDAKADARVPFVGLMYHGRDTGAYEIPADDLDAYVASRVERVTDGEVAPLDLRLSDGSVLRFQCAVLPNGGRLLTYTYVTDIVRHSDQLETLRSALDNLEDGVMLFDAALKLDFINRKARAFWSIPDHDTVPGVPLMTIMDHTQLMFDVPAEQFDAFVSERLAKSVLAILRRTTSAPSTARPCARTARNSQAAAAC